MKNNRALRLTQYRPRIANWTTRQFVITSCSKFKYSSRFVASEHFLPPNGLSVRTRVSAGDIFLTEEQRLFSQLISQEGKPILDPAYYSKITLDDAEAIFRGDDKEVEIPLMQERLQVLHEAGDVLLRKYQGTFETCIKSCEGSALKLLDLIVNEFKAYRDEAVYEGQRVSLYKRAQILIGDIWSCFKGCGIGEFHDINSITMFADYRIPQVFLYFGAFRYSDSLLKKLQADEPLESGSREEVEIRGCSIELVERLCIEVRKMIDQTCLNPKAQKVAKHVNAILIDQFLWDYRRKFAKEIDEKHLPFHKTRCIYY